MKNLLFILFLLLNLKAQSNDSIVKFNAKGHLVQIKLNKGINVKDLKFDFDNLKDIDKENKIKARSVLLEKVKEARRIIVSTRYKQAAHLFYMRLWDNDSIHILSYLDHISETLHDGKISKKPSDQEKNFNDVFNKYLSDDIISSFYIKVNETTNSIEFYQRDLLNSFLIDFINLIFISAGNTTKTSLHKEKYVESTYGLLEQKKEFDNQYKIVFERYKNMNQFDSTFYDSIIQLHNLFESHNSEFSKAIKLLKDNMFIDFFWLNGGNIRFNPFDITTEKLIRLKPDYNLLAKPYSDSIFNFPLSPILETRYDSIASLLSYNDTSAYKTDQLLNSVLFSNDSSFYFNLSNQTEIKFSNESKTLDDSLRVGQKKHILLHNIPFSKTPGISEQEKFYDDKSPFQIGFDTVVAQFGELGKLYIKFTSFAPILDFIGKQNLTAPNHKIQFNKISNGVNLDSSIDNTKSIPPVKSLKLKPFTFSYSKDSDNFNDVLILALKSRSVFDKTIFDQIFHEKITFGNVHNKLKVYEKLINEYFSRITNQAINQLRLDSFYLASVIDIYNKSTAPQFAVNKIIDTNALYFTKLLETKPSKKAITKDITVFSFNKKDTSVIQKFTYDVHQYYRVKFSAGIAYTVTPFNQSVATESNGSISVVNDIRLYRFLVGVHYYFLGKGLFNQSNKFLNPLCERLSLYLGVGIPDPLGNVYFGISGDLLPGLKLTTGAHIVKNNKYLIQNNRIIEETLRYQFGGPFIALQIDPASLINVLNIFKK